ncbi:hypothetical protein EMIHUDRAFT_219003 [Emiliania huxleyi CCMP1516]|uniref:Uncharacterized protein n=2 Tax=Emiliania huxleyi TaxID=2903 RepID=A0A0D3I5J8_EMIH1|nr:hypothetical protein EMIHUDRAFT_219003 [Emiliania huxleyi CCMP1516]EOD06533.1 hypothetical protein EMIHUDRAFT_219003 [Emiliania huxleyi CCMP1516]|eukprot:XP_005758962.1 hypothetical protein EMIHUDRAFT_219003 [Emiliania huxleyi CCMP1516]
MEQSSSSRSRRRRRKSATPAPPPTHSVACLHSATPTTPLQASTAAPATPLAATPFFSPAAPQSEDFRQWALLSPSQARSFLRTPRVTAASPSPTSAAAPVAVAAPAAPNPLATLPPWALRLLAMQQRALLALRQSLHAARADARSLACALADADEELALRASGGRAAAPATPRGEGLGVVADHRGAQPALGPCCAADPLHAWYAPRSGSGELSALPPAPAGRLAWAEAEALSLLLDIYNWLLGQGPPFSRRAFWLEARGCSLSGHSLALLHSSSPSAEEGAAAALVLQSELRRARDAINLRLMRTNVAMAHAESSATWADAAEAMFGWLQACAPSPRPRFPSLPSLLPPMPLSACLRGGGGVVRLSAPAGQRLYALNDTGAEVRVAVSPCEGGEVAPLSGDGPLCGALRLRLRFADAPGPAASKPVDLVVDAQRVDGTSQYNGECEDDLEAAGPCQGRGQRPQAEEGARGDNPFARPEVGRCFEVEEGAAATPTSESSLSPHAAEPLLRQEGHGLSHAEQAGVRVGSTWESPSTRVAAGERCSPKAAPWQIERAGTLLRRAEEAWAAQAKSLAQESEASDCAAGGGETRLSPTSPPTGGDGVPVATIQLHGPTERAAALALTKAANGVASLSSGRTSLARRATAALSRLPLKSEAKALESRRELLVGLLLHPTAGAAAAATAEASAAEWVSSVAARVVAAPAAARPRELRGLQAPRVSMVVEAFRAASAASGPKESAEWDGPALAAAATRLEGVCSALKKLARAEAPPRATTHPRVSPRGSTSSKGGAAGSTARSPLQPIDSAHSGANAKTTDSAEGATASLRQEPTGGAPTMPQARDADAAAAQDADPAAAQDADAAAAPAAPPKPAAVAAAVPPAATPPDAQLEQERKRLFARRCSREAARSAALVATRSDATEIGAAAPAGFAEQNGAAAAVGLAAEHRGRGGGLSQEAVAEALGVD